ncbi:hypothetical protein PVAP13_9NG769277 [Panicum virgatum]|uniref:Uncharacterized protein n=1 Tax=Panicum virgatum TaxID=38727 RepID=A0A8T0N1Y0_PANVG|nr:hypothetical protein PVAP13_9NG769277 [Panicum virgatum]
MEELLDVSQLTVHPPPLRLIAPFFSPLSSPLLSFPSLSSLFPFSFSPILSLREIPGSGGAAELRERGRQSSGDLPWAAWVRHGAAAGSPIADPIGAPALRPPPFEAPPVASMTAAAAGIPRSLGRRAPPDPPPGSPRAPPRSAGTQICFHGRRVPPWRRRRADPSPPWVRPPPRSPGDREARRGSAASPSPASPFFHFFM